MVHVCLYAKSQLKWILSVGLVACSCNYCALQMLAIDCKRLLTPVAKKRVKFHFFPPSNKCKFYVEQEKIQMTTNNKQQQRRPRQRTNASAWKKNIVQCLHVFVVVACSNMSTILNLWPLALSEFEEMNRNKNKNKNKDHQKGNCTNAWAQRTGEKSSNQIHTQANK